MMQGISLCDHVTERDVTERGVIGQYELIVERERYHSRNLVTERDVTERVNACERLRCSLRGRPHIPLQG